VTSLADPELQPATKDRVICFFDGACPGNQFALKGQMRAAFVVGQKSFIRDVPDLATPDGPLRSNNIAEYQGLIMLLERLQEEENQNGARGSYLICGDSELVIKQVLGSYRVRQPHLQPLHARATRLADGLEAKFRHVRRESNRAGFLLE
jgi:ribonuclease HI